MNSTLRRYKYLTIDITKPRVRHFKLLILLLQLNGVFVLGLAFGFSFCDVIFSSCTEQIVTQQKQKELKPLRHIVSVPPSKPFLQHHIAVPPPRNMTKKKRPPTLKNLPEKFLKNYPPKKPASLFSLEPWKYLERMQSGRFFMTFLIKSACHLVDRRFYIRRTWGSVSAINENNFGIIFLVGLTANKEQQELLQQESELFGDILQSDVLDNYFSLPTKVLAGFQWVTYNTGDVSDYYVTTDDDCVINMPTVYDYFCFHKETLGEKIHCGYIFNRGSAPMRKEHFKWGVSRDVYPADSYPVFCHGGMTIWSFSKLSAIYHTSETTNRTGMHLEDVLISGILRMKTYNSSDDIIPRGYRGRKGKYRPPEHFVFHLGLSTNIKKAFILRWHEGKNGLRMGAKDPMRSKHRSAYHYNATQFKFPVLPDHNVNSTVVYFTSRWSKLKPQRKRIFPSEKIDSSNDNKNINENKKSNREATRNEIKNVEEQSNSEIDERLLEY